MQLPCENCICFPICVNKAKGQLIELFAYECKLLEKYIYEHVKENLKHGGVEYDRVNDERSLIAKHYFKYKVVLK